MGTSRNCSQREVPNAMIKSLLPHWVTYLECYYFITHVRNCVMGATPMKLTREIMYGFKSAIGVIHEGNDMCHI